MSDTQALLGAVALIIVAVALNLALAMLVLVEARWTLGLWASLRRSWNETVRQRQDAGMSHDRAPERDGDD
jgi:hypothetical protein